MRDTPEDSKQNLCQLCVELLRHATHFENLMAFGSTLTSLLDEVQSNRRNAYGTIESPDKPQLIIFGNESTDKTRLIECINSNTSIQCGIGLDYQFLSLHEDGREDSLHMGVWSLDPGDSQQCNLLKFALNKSTIWHTMGIICIDYTEPWSLLNDLELWLQMIEQHINYLKIDSEEIEHLKSSMQNVEQQQNDQDDQSNEKSVEQQYQQQQSNKWLKNLITEGVMNKLLPIPIMIVVTKTDMTDLLEKEFGFTDEKFDYILYNLRKLCLEYGAALIYISIKEDINTNTLVNYIKHRLFDLPLKNSAMLVDPKAIFIPAGWDSLHRLELFKKNLSPNLMDCHYNQIITKPSKLRRKTSCGMFNEFCIRLSCN
ncbi:putative dynein light intermediate chain [Schistosoma mansoni]|uniref:putative dynein light intermediate chain n=1 Tax=Schistosoma mansoni TaxID=6183 RepID=UPI00022DC058|nr:putative dynein light intermediate chain [Schistosoma mansoni]|eukprot:XP_018652780.1 putative dynein light intermediate chain [Schistosoma mansoni]